MSYPRCGALGVSAVSMLGLCIGAGAQDTYTQGASPERRAPAETMPIKQGTNERNGQSGQTRHTEESSRTDAGAPGRTQAQEIKAAIEDELYHDVLLSLDDVNVSVDAGTAALSGTVASLTAKERAADVARTVKGVTSVANKLTVHPYVQRTAEELESAITQALLLNPATESFQVQVQAEPDGSVRLSGNVESWAERELAARVAQGIVGVTDVSNDLQVSHASPRLDTEIAAEVERMLQWDAYVEDSQIDVRVRDGVVALSGSVGSAAEKDRAVRMAWTAGTRAVDADKLRITADGTDGINKQSAQLSDANIADAVKRRLQSSPYAPQTPIDVLVDDRVVTLSGAVDSLKAKRVANTIATQTNGVTHVRDRLRVRRNGSAPTDEELRSRIEGALAANAITEAYEISVNVNRGNATLTGQVDTWLEKGAADDVVANVTGVRDVDNDLRVTNAAERLAFDPYVDAWSIYDFDWYQPAPVTVWKLDSVLEQEIENELMWSPFVDANEVNVTVDDGVATLTGSVDSLAESSAAQENAFEGGAAGVINELRIQG